MVTRKTFLAVTAALLATVGSGYAWGETSEAERAELAKAMQGAKLTLEDGLKASEKSGKPISAKFEIEDGALQFSAYTMSGDDFSEVVADPSTGRVAKSEKITDDED